MERKKIEMLEEKYLRWIMGVEGRIPGFYLLREKMLSLRGKN